MYNQIMKSVKILPIILLLILISAGAFFGYKTLTKKTTQEGDGTSQLPLVEQKAQEEESLFSGKITDLLSLGKSIKCTYSLPVQDGTTGTGTILVSGTKMRGDSTITTADNGTIESHFISMDNTMYTWSPSMPRGFKMAIDPETINSETPGEIPEEAKALQEQMDYKCLPWIPDQSVFELPADVEFVDLSELTKSLPAAGDTGNNCAVCDLAQTEEAKAQCLASLNCE